MISRYLARALGNGDVRRGRAAIETFVIALLRARRLHPTFALSSFAAYEVVREELRELSVAISFEGERRVRAEQLDTLVTAWRMYMREYEQNSEGDNDGQVV